MSEEALSFCKIDANLDTNPKIRQAGRDGRDVFEFVVRRNSLMGRDGSIPLKYIEPWYLADVLMMTADEASHGVSRAVTACLIELDKSRGVVRIVGWTPEWGRTRMTDAERKAAQRAREKAAIVDNQSESLEPVTKDRDSRDMSHQVTAVTDQIRGEEIREERESAAAPLALAPQDSPGLQKLKAKVDRAARRAAKPKPVEVPIPDDWTPTDSHRTRCSELRVDLAYESGQFKNNAASKALTYVDWNAAFHTWIGKSAKWASERNARPGGHTSAGEPPRRIPVAQPRLSEDT